MKASSIAVALLLFALAGCVSDVDARDVGGRWAALVGTTYWEVFLHDLDEGETERDIDWTASGRSGGGYATVLDNLDVTATVYWCQFFCPSGSGGGLTLLGRFTGDKIDGTFTGHMGADGVVFGPYDRLPVTFQRP